MEEAKTLDCPVHEIQVDLEKRILTVSTELPAPERGQQWVKPDTTKFFGPEHITIRLIDTDAY